jgi:hypothetical protein
MVPVREYALSEWKAFGDAPPVAEPYIVRGAGAAWPAMSRLTIEGLRAIAGDLVVACERSSKPDELHEMPLGAFLDYCVTADETDPLYLRSWQYRQTHPSIRDWMEPPRAFRSWTDIIPGHEHNWSWLFIGARHSGGHPHVDVWLSAAYNVVLSGCKEWRVYPADHAVSLALRRDAPMAANAVESGDVWTCRQMPGDLIFVPSGFAHSVVNRQPGIAFTENFINALNYDAVVRMLEDDGRADVIRALQLIRVAAAFGKA